MKEINGINFFAIFILLTSFQVNAGVIVQTYDFTFDALTRTSVYDESSRQGLPSAASFSFGTSQQEQQWFYDPFDTSLGHLNSVTIELSSDVSFSHRYDVRTGASGGGFVSTHVTSTGIALTPSQNFRLNGIGIPYTTNATFRAAERRCSSTGVPPWPPCPSGDQIDDVFNYTTTFFDSDYALETYLDTYSGLDDFLLLRNTANVGAITCSIWGTASCSSGFFNQLNDGWEGSIALTYDYTTNVPEPSALILMGLGLSVIYLQGKRKFHTG